MRSKCLMGTKCQFWKMNKVLELDDVMVAEQCHCS